MDRHAIRRVGQLAGLLLAAAMEDITSIEALEAFRALLEHHVWTVRALVSRDTPPDFSSRRTSQLDEVGRVGVRRQLLLVAVSPRQWILTAEILDVAEPVAKGALGQPAPEMRADPPKDHADLVFRVVLDRQDRPALIPVLTTHMLGEVAAIAQALPNERIALQWDVCQEVIAREGYYEPGPVDFRKETIAELIAIGDGVPAAIELGYHLCYGSPADEHVIQPKDAGIMVEIVNAVSTGVRRPIQFFHLPVPKPRIDDAYFAPLAGLKLRSETELYFGLVHRDDMAGNAARLGAARRHVRVDGVATECGMARGDPERFPALLIEHAQTAELS
jgi:hypothetical protein